MKYNKNTIFMKRKHFYLCSYYMKFLNYGKSPCPRSSFNKKAPHVFSK